MAKKKAAVLTMKSAADLILGISDDKTAEGNIKTVFAMMGVLIHSQEGQPGLKAMNKAIQTFIKEEEKLSSAKKATPKKAAKKPAKKVVKKKTAKKAK